ncbi:MAG TPA: hypothetical protein VFY98_07975 [Intrasporangium sp.]|nr:hypothetical protein [Intrasporangium sp.]
MWDVIFEAPLTAETLGAVPLPACVVEGSATSVVDHHLCHDPRRLVDLNHPRDHVVVSIDVDDAERRVWCFSDT